MCVCVLSAARGCARLRAAHAYSRCRPRTGGVTNWALLIACGGKRGTRIAHSRCAYERGSGWVSPTPHPPHLAFHTFSGIVRARDACKSCAVCARCAAAPGAGARPRACSGRDQEAFRLLSLSMNLGVQGRRPPGPGSYLSSVTCAARTAIYFSCIDELMVGVRENNENT